MIFSRRSRSVLGCAVLTLAALLAGGSVGGTAANAAPLRDVMAIGNGQGGTVSFIDTAT